MDYDFLNVSDGTGDASLMHVTATRVVGSTTITVDTIVKIPAKFIATSGNILSSGLLDPTTVTNFKGHISGSALQIDSFEPGSTDLGNTSGQVIIVKPNTGWANRVANHVKNMTGFGTPENVTVNNLTASGTVTLPASSIPTAAIANAAVTPSKWTNPYKFSAYASAAQPLTANVLAKVQFNTENFDTGSNYDNVTNYRYTAPMAGFYFITTQVNIGAAGLGSGTFALCYIYKNGAEARRSQSIPGTGTATSVPIPAISDLFQLAAGDYLEVFCDTSDNSRYTGGGLNLTYFSGFLVSQT